MKKKWGKLRANGRDWNLPLVFLRFLPLPSFRAVFLSPEFTHPRR
jgi:hypothetical protein